MCKNSQRYDLSNKYYITNIKRPSERVKLHYFKYPSIGKLFKKAFKNLLNSRTITPVNSAHPIKNMQIDTFPSNLG